MKILVTFDFDCHLISIPDGYICTVPKLKEDFLTWVENQPTHITTHCGYCFNHEVFLHYLNDVVLIKANEKAYELKNVNSHKGVPIIRF